MSVLRRLVIRFQNRLLAAFLDELLSDLNTFSYPRGHQLRRSLARDPASHPEEITR